MVVDLEEGEGSREEEREREVRALVIESVDLQLLVLN
jgi:hypothetical protein